MYWCKIIDMWCKDMDDEDRSFCECYGDCKNCDCCENLEAEENKNNGKV